MTNQIAWCWASGLIEIGDAMPPDGTDGAGAIQIATGPKAVLEAELAVLARHGQGASSGKFLVPGVPEANDGIAAINSLTQWLAWCCKRKKHEGVEFAQPRSPVSTRASS